jgi:hypothetical protein
MDDTDGTGERCMLEVKVKWMMQIDGRALWDRGEGEMDDADEMGSPVTSYGERSW